MVRAATIASVVTASHGHVPWWARWGGSRLRRLLPRRRWGEFGRLASGAKQKPQHLPEDVDSRQVMEPQLFDETRRRRLLGG
jgi:hypothetical protein